MATSREYRQKLGELVFRQRAIIERAEKEERKISPEEDVEMRRLETEMEDLEPIIERLTAIESREQKLSNPTSKAIKLGPDGNAAADADDEQRELVKRFKERFGLMGVHLAKRIPGNQMASIAYRTAFDRWLCSPKGSGLNTLTGDERRALSVGTAAEGGYTVPQEEFVAELIKSVDDQTPLRELARKFQVPQAVSLGAPALSADPDDADWTVELGTGTEDSTMAFGKRQMTPNPLAKRLKVSDKLLRASPLGMETIVRDRLAHKLAIAHSKAFNSGDGASKPLGMYTPSANGISTGRDVDISTSGAMDPDKLIAARYTLRPGYWRNARWHMHRNILAIVRKLKTGTSPNQYLWQPGLTVGAPNMLLDFEYVVDENAPSDATPTAARCMMLGDFQQYWVVDALGMTIQRLDELYAESAQVGYIIRAETDGMPVLEDAFVACTATIS